MGRPRKYSDDVMNGDSLVGDGFTTERNLCDYVEANMESFSTDILGSPYVSHQREYKLYQTAGNRAPKGSRADFFIDTKDGPIVVEAKNPTQARHELNRAVSQLLAQGSAFKRMHGVMPRMILLTSRYSTDIIDVIKDFNLPIEVVIISKDYAMRVGF